MCVYVCVCVCMCLIELNELMSKIVGRPVKKAYSFLCGYARNPQTSKDPWLLAHTDREDNEYTFSVTLHHGLLIFFY